MKPRIDPGERVERVVPNALVITFRVGRKRLEDKPLHPGCGFWPSCMN
jgi:hypothetical protein